MSEQLLLTPRQAKHALQISERTLRDLTNLTKEIPCVRIGKSLRYDMAEIRAFIERKKQPARVCAAA